jgi:hypothetical protein
MRYERGSIAISTGQDLPLLRQVLQSQFITHDQLFEFMRHGCYELKRSSFNWRVLRLVQKGFLDRHSVRASCVYSIADAGASFLAVTENYCPVLHRRHHKDARSYDHSLELNELHLSLIRQGLLEEWKPEIAIRSKNELTPHGYVKDYDAIVTVKLDGRTTSFALEYERTPKKPTAYLRIRRLLEQEDQLHRFLYVVPYADLASFILDCFAGTTVTLLIGFATDFARSFSRMRVVEAGSGLTKPVAMIL